MMTGEKSNQLLGEYLIDAGLLNLDELREAANIARNQNLPVGKVLVMSGYLSKELLQTTVELQARVKDEQLDYKIAVEALGLISLENITLDKALSTLNQENKDGEKSNRLGEFLSGACLVSNGDLSAAIEESIRCGLPLGRVLVNLAIISQPVLNNVLNMQSLVRHGKMTKEEAIKTLLANKEKQMDGQPILPATQSSSFNQQPDNNGAAVVGEATPKRKRSSTKNRITGQFPNLPALSLHHMLRAAGLIETAALEKAIKFSLEDTEIMTAILRQGNLLEDFVIEAAKQCCQLIAKRQLKPEQAIIGLHRCQRTRESLDDCLIEFGWLQEREAVPKISS